MPRVEKERQQYGIKSRQERDTREGVKEWRKRRKAGKESKRTVFAFYRCSLVSSNNTQSCLALREMEDEFQKNQCGPSSTPAWTTLTWREWE